MFSLILTKIEKYQHRYPGKALETFDALFYDARGFRGKAVKVVVGFGERVALGARRARAVVFVGGEPVVEFLGADDYNRSGLLLSPIRKDTRPLRAEGPLPVLYYALRTVRLSDYIKKAPKTAAVLVESSDIRGMVHHAFNSKRMKGEFI